MSQPDAEPSSLPRPSQNEGLLIHQAGGILQGLAFAMQQSELASLGNALITMSLGWLRNSPQQKDSHDDSSGDSYYNGSDLLSEENPEADV